MQGTHAGHIPLKHAGSHSAIPRTPEFAHTTSLSHAQSTPSKGVVHLIRGILLGAMEQMLQPRQLSLVLLLQRACPTTHALVEPLSHVLQLFLMLLMLCC